jgi:uncharacterized RDD family membrane protein YckC
MKRILAIIIDICLLVFTSLCIGVLFDFILTVYFRIKFNPTPIFGVLFYLFYFKYIPQKWNGQTIGKKVVRIER